MSKMQTSAPLSDDRLALQAIHRLRTTQVRYRDKLVARLQDLLRDYQDDYDGRSLSPGAIDVLVTFLNANRRLRRPRVSATPSGDLYAEWTGPADRLLGVRFMPSGEVQYVICTPNTLHKDGSDVRNNNTDTMLEKLVHLRDQGWHAE